MSKRTTKSTDNGKRVANVSKPRHLKPDRLVPVLGESKTRVTSQNVKNTSMMSQQSTTKNEKSGSARRSLKNTVVASGRHEQVSIIDTTE